MPRRDILRCSDLIELLNYYCCVYNILEGLGEAS